MVSYHVPAQPHQPHHRRCLSCLLNISIFVILRDNTRLLSHSHYLPLDSGNLCLAIPLHNLLYLHRAGRELERRKRTRIRRHKWLSIRNPTGRQGFRRRSVLCWRFHRHKTFSKEPMLLLGRGGGGGKEGSALIGQPRVNALT